MNAIIYARFSPRRHEETCESIETQLELCRKHCEAQGWEIVGEYSDRALSGKDAGRPGLWDAIDALKRGFVLLVYRQDRLARDAMLAIKIERDVEKKRARIVSLAGEGTEGDEPHHRLMRNMLRDFAQYEREVTALRTKIGMLRLQRNGRRMSDRTPYGWARDKKNPAFMIENPVEQEGICWAWRVIFPMRLTLIASVSRRLELPCTLTV